MPVKSVMQRLHDSEINCRIECFWDQQWSAYIGDDMNGYKAENHNLGSYDEAETWLALTAIGLYPGSVFSMGEPQSASQG